MRRALAVLLIVGCGKAPSHQRLVVGEPPSWGANQLRLGSWAIGSVALPGFVEVGRTVDPQLTSVVYEQQFHGVPVISGHMAIAIAHGRVILVEGNEVPTAGLDPTPAFGEASAIATVDHELPAPHAGDRDDTRLVVWPKPLRLAWEVTAWRDIDQTIAYVDAHDGTVLYAYDGNRYEHAGTATAEVDPRTVGDDMVTEPASYLRLRTLRGSTTLTDGDGAFEFRGESGPLVVNANLQGAYVDVLNLDGNNAAFVGVMKPETQYKLEWTEARSLPEERDVFRGTNTTNRFVATVFPDLPWINQPVPAKVNHPRHCNAFWNGTSINFFEAGDGCNNTGRIFDVVAHEWGHGLDQNAPGGASDGALGEFIGDLLSFIQTKSPLLAPNFLTNGGHVRDMDDPHYQCFDPDIEQVHAAGNLLGAVVFDIQTDLEKAGVTGEQLKRLLLRPIAIAQTRAEWYAAMLAVDDDDGNLANGTPHECLIYKQYKAHSCAGVRWPGMPDEDPEGCR